MVNWGAKVGISEGPSPVGANAPEATHYNFNESASRNSANDHEKHIQLNFNT